MKSLVLLLTVLSLRASGFLIEVPKTINNVQSIATGGWIHRQKLILALFENTCDDSSNPMIVRMSNDFTFDALNDKYVKPDAVTNLQNLINGKGLFPKGEIFTEYNEDNLYELKTVYNLMYYAKTFDAFYNAATWARQNVNCGLFIDAIYTVLLHRRDTEKIAIPPPYEIFPNYFINKDVIFKASLLLSGDEVTPSADVHSEGNVYTVDANYTADFIENNDESMLAYFIEDVGLNSHHYLKKLQNCAWAKEYNKTNLGEYWYHYIKQLIARFNLERYANGFTEVEGIILENVKNIVYDPMLIYSNGHDFPKRSTTNSNENLSELPILKNMEIQLPTIASHLLQNGYNKTEIINHLMEILVFGDNSYETIALRLFGQSDTSTKCPSVLEHYMTSLRDPISWKIYKRIIEIMDEALNNLPNYSRSEIYFPGVEIMNVIIKKASTNCDYYDFDVTNALKSNQTVNKVQIKIRQPRLNHKPFSMKLNISSYVSQKGFVKIYITPKVLPGKLIKNRNSFFLIDYFEVNLKAGVNVISRTSDQMKSLSDDFISLQSLIKNIEDTEFGLNTLTLKDIESYTHFPARLVIPKGSSSGMPYDLFVFVAPYTKTLVGNTYISEFNSAILSPGFPFDSNIDNQLFDLPNTIFKEIIVTHKTFSFGDTDTSKKWGEGKAYDPSSRPTYDYSSKKQSNSYDYSAMKGQYGNNSDNIGKRGITSKPDTTTVNIGSNTDDNVLPEVIRSQLDIDYEKDLSKKLNKNQISNSQNIDSNTFSNLESDSASLQLETKKPPSVFDYHSILPYFGINIDDYEEKVYE